jgi:hypothetical protein
MYFQKLCENPHEPTQVGLEPITSCFLVQMSWKKEGVPSRRLGKLRGRAVKMEVVGASPTE